MKIGSAKIGQAVVYVSPLMHAYSTLAQMKEDEVGLDKSKPRFLAKMGKSHSNVIVGLSQEIEHSMSNLSNGQMS